VLFLNGAAGDINHIDAQHPGRTKRGYGYSERVGTILASEVLKVRARMDAVAGQDDPPREDPLRSAAQTVSVPLRRISGEELAQAKELLEAFTAGDFVTENMSDVARVAGAYRSVDLAQQPDRKEMEVQAIRFGNAVFVGLPGEVFAGIGESIRSESPFAHTFVVSLVNGSFGYFPTAAAFREGGYESKNTPFTPELESLLLSSVRDVLARVT
jgi:hypothetical protein